MNEQSHEQPLWRRKGPLAAAAAVLVISALALSVYWARSGPAALPSGQPLTIVTEPSSIHGTACLMAVRPSVQMRRSGSEVVFSQNGQDEAITWPYGTTAWLVNGQAELFAPDRTLTAIEGQTLPDLGGGLGGADDRFHVCAIGGRSYPH
jgi:hypothetical protein